MSGMNADDLVDPFLAPRGKEERLCAFVPNTPPMAVAGGFSLGDAQRLSLVRPALPDPGRRLTLLGSRKDDIPDPDAIWPLMGKQFDFGNAVQVRLKSAPEPKSVKLVGIVPKNDEARPQPDPPSPPAAMSKQPLFAALQDPPKQIRAETDLEEENRTLLRIVARQQVEIDSLRKRR